MTLSDDEMEQCQKKHFDGIWSNVNPLWNPLIDYIPALTVPAYSYEQRLRP